MLHPGDIRRLAADSELAPVGADADAELRFKVLEVLVVAAEQRLDVLVGNSDLANDGGGRYGVTPVGGPTVELPVYYTRCDPSVRAADEARRDPVRTARSAVSP